MTQIQDSIVDAEATGLSETAEGIVSFFIHLVNIQSTSTTIQ